MKTKTFDVDLVMLIRSVNSLNNNIGIINKCLWCQQLFFFLRISFLYRNPNPYHDGHKMFSVSEVANLRALGPSQFSDSRKAVDVLFSSFIGRIGFFLVYPKEADAEDAVVSEEMGR